MREVLKRPDVTAVTLVDLDPRVTQLFKDHPQLSALNGKALSDPKVTLIHQDAWVFIKDAPPLAYDLIVADLPDPSTIGLSKLYSQPFYDKLLRSLTADGLFVTQATSPVYAKDAFWSIHATIESVAGESATGESAAGEPVAGEPVAGRQRTVVPYQAYVPSFGAWGFVRVGRLAKGPIKLEAKTRFFSPQIDASLTVFAADQRVTAPAINTLGNHALTGLYEKGWSRWFAE